MNHIGQAPQSITPFGREQLRDIPAVRVIPYEYVADFALQGGTVDNVGNLVQDVINISVEGIFVAVSIGYGLDEEPATSLRLITPLGPTLPPHSVRSGSRISRPMSYRGFRLNPNMRAIAIQQNGQLNGDLPVTPETFQRLKSADNFSFLLSIVDTGTGRELQNRPSIAWQRWAALTDGAVQDAAAAHGFPASLDDSSPGRGANERRGGTALHHAARIQGTRPRGRVGGRDAAIRRL